MSEASGFCPVCGKFMVWPESHRCPPKFIVWDPNDGIMDDAGTEVRGRDHADAAEEWADANDCDRSYSIVGGNEVVVCVVPAAAPTDPVKRFRITGEYIAHYNAEEEPE